MNQTKMKIFQAGAAFFLLLYVFTMLAVGIQQMLMPTVSASRIARGTLLNTGTYDATVLARPSGEQLTVQWAMRGDEADLLEGGTVQCIYYTEDAGGGLTRLQKDCKVEAAENKPDAENTRLLTGAVAS
ncbi:MAG: hypothetical protein PHG73_11110, partial [Pygmaiobacter sp.]|nr:hypothetical protein [Pygmaiobacter sp.]